MVEISRLVAVLQVPGEWDMSGERMAEDLVVPLRVFYISVFIYI